MISFVTQAVLFSGELWIFILSLDLYISLTNPFSSYKNNVKRYQIAAFASTVAISTVLVAQGSCQGSIFKEGVCWIRVASVLSPCIWGFFFVWCCIFYVSSMGVVAFAFTRLRSGLEITYETRKSCVSDSSIVVFSYIFYGAIIAALIVINSIKSSKDNFTEFLLAYMISMRGFVDGLVWFYLHDFSKDNTSLIWVDRFTRKVYGPFECLWTAMAFWCKIGEANDVDGKGFGGGEERLLVGAAAASPPNQQTSTSSASPLDSFSNTLESPLWSQSHQKASILSDAESGSGSLVDRKYLLREDRKSLLREDTASHRDTLVAVSDTDALDVDLSPQLNMALRAELLHYVTFGIYESVKRAEDREVEHRRQVQIQAELLSQRFSHRPRAESAQSNDAWAVNNNKNNNESTYKPYADNNIKKEKEKEKENDRGASTSADNATATATPPSTPSTPAPIYGSSSLQRNASWMGGQSHSESFRQREGIQSYKSNTTSIRY